MQREQIKELIDANKRSKALLDRRVRDLQTLCDAEDERGMFESAKEYPYFCGAVGSDGQPGILASAQFVDNADIDIVSGRGAGRDISIGMVQLQADAPFVWTHIAVSKDFASSLAGVQLGFVENGSGRVLFQAETRARKGEGELLESSLFNTLREYGPSGQVDGSFVGQGIATPGVYSTGHGPSALFELPVETVLPVNGSVTVQARLPFATRLFVALVGYKLFGD